MKAPALVQGAIQIGYGVIAMVLGAFCAAVLPTILWAHSRQEANAVAGYQPNVDPFTIVSVAAIFAVPIVCVALVIELVRTWVYGARPLTCLPSLVLGAVATWPVGLSICLHSLDLGIAGIALASAFSVLVFHVCRLNLSSKPATRP